MALAVAALLSCEKEVLEGQENTPAPGMVKMTFNVSETAVDAETRVVLNGRKFEWEKGDKVGILVPGYDDVYSFEALEAGASTVISGELPETAVSGPFYAVYPYDAEAKITTWDNNGTAAPAITTTIALEQNAVENSIPRETPFVAYSEDGRNLSFKTVANFVCITIQEDNINKVVLENINWHPIAGQFDFDAVGGSYKKESGSEKEVALVGDFKKGSTYYLAKNAISMYNGFFLKMYNNAGEVWYRTVSKSVSGGRGQVVRVGDLSYGILRNFEEVDDQHYKWIHGANFKVGNTIINKYTHPWPVVEVDGSSKKITDTSVNFVDSDQECEFGNVKQMIVMSKYRSRPATVRHTRLYLSPSADTDYLIFNNVKLIHEINSSTEEDTKCFVLNADADYDKVIFDKVTMTIPGSRRFLVSTSAARKYLDVEFANCDITIEAAGAELINAGNTDNFYFVNNIVSATSGAAASGFYAMNVSKANLICRHNTFVNVYPKDAFFQTSSDSFTAMNEVSNNLICFSDYDGLVGTASAMTGVKFSAANTLFSDNYVVYDSETVPENGLALNAAVAGDAAMILNKTLKESAAVIDIGASDLANGILVCTDSRYGAIR